MMTMIPVNHGELEPALYKSLPLQMRRMLGIIARGMRHVALPEGVPMKVSIVLEYAETTVRHEFTT